MSLYPTPDREQYERIEDVKLTTNNVYQRLFGVVSFNKIVYEEIIYVTSLKKEAIRLALLGLSISIITQTIYFSRFTFFRPDISIYFLGIQVVGPIMFFVYLYLLIINQKITSRTGNKQKLISTFSHAYFLYSLSQLLILFWSNSFVILIYFMSQFYLLIIFVNFAETLSQKGYLNAIILTIGAYFLYFVTTVVLTIPLFFLGRGE